MKGFVSALVGASLIAGSVMPRAGVRVAASAGGGAPLPVMLLDGESGGPYHRWQVTTPVLKKALDETGLFTVEVVTAPQSSSTLDKFSPDFGRYAAIVLNYDAPDERWPASLKSAFEHYVTAGGGLVSVHAADNAFPHWPAYNEMIGVGGWRNRNESAGPIGTSWTALSNPIHRRAPPAVMARVRRLPSRSKIRTIQLPRVCQKRGCTRVMSSTRRSAVRDGT